MADMQIRNIREKIEPKPKSPRYVLTARHELQVRRDLDLSEYP